MTPSSISSDLTGKILIAMPGMADMRFDRSVIFMCAHSDEGAMGLIVNKASADIPLRGLLEQLSIDITADLDRQMVHFGGPVEQGRGFVLHGPDFASDVSTLQVDDRFAMTATLDILEALATDDGPRQSLVMLGYAGWGPGQLEGEIAENGWLVAEATEELVFDLPNDRKWEAAINSLGVSVLALSAEGGRA